MKKIGLLGCGAIGMQIAQAIDSGTIPAKLVSVYDQDEKRASALIAKLSDKPRMAQNAHMLSSEDVDLVVEAASQDARTRCGAKCATKSPRFDDNEFWCTA